MEVSRPAGIPDQADSKDVLRYPVLVASLGHCGSSSVTQQLCELGYHMGYGARFNMRHMVTAGEVAVREDEILTRITGMRDWDAYHREIETRKQWGIPWGFKVNPGWSKVAEQMVAPFDMVYIVHPIRNEDASKRMHNEEIASKLSHLPYLAIQFDDIVEGRSAAMLKEFLCH